MSSRLRKVLPFVVLAVAALVVVFGMPNRRAASRRSARLAAVRAHEEDLNVILISLDTTRADRLGCYGCGDAETPAIDSFSDAGIRFGCAKTHVPITLPSHSTVFTGTTPVLHGAHHHFSPLADEGNVTIAEILKGHGYTTAGFIAAFVLDRSLGMDQGFQHYADNLGYEGPVGAARLERRAGEVLEEARAWLDENAGEKFFAFIHLYDPHLPYLPPPPYDLRYSERPYEGEIAYMDAEFGKFMDYMDTAGLSHNTLVVVFGDHGESLGERGIEGHSAFVYETVTWVPLLMRCPGLLPEGRTVFQQVRLVDVLPTVLDILGIEVPTRVQGTSLLPYAEGHQGLTDLPAYVESYALNDVFGWSPLLAVETGRWKYIRAPGPELYDLAADPDENDNLYRSHTDIASGLDAMLEDLLGSAGSVSTADEPGAPDEAIMEKLSSLGYIGTGASTRGAAAASEAGLPDPKDMMDIYLFYQRAVVASSYERHKEAVEALVELHRRIPANNAVARLLAKNYFWGGRVEEAVPLLEEDLEAFPDDSLLNVSLGMIYGQRGMYAEAERCLKKALKSEVHAPGAMATLGSIHMARREFDRAQEMFRGVLKLEGVDRESNYVSLINLGTLHFLVKHEPREAIACFERALAMDPGSGDAHYYLALIFSQEPERSADAVAHARAFLESDAADGGRRATIESILADLK